MRIELAQSHFEHGVGDFDIGHVLSNPEGRAVTIVKFSGYSEIDEADGMEHEAIQVHFDDDSVIDFEDLDRAVFIARSYRPLSPDWFVEEVDQPTAPEKPTKPQRKVENQTLREAAARFDTRPIQHLSDAELFAKVSRAPLDIGEAVLTAFDGNLARIANATAKQMQKITGIGERRAEKIVATFELGKRLARFHAEKPKITAPSDVADLMMSKMRYLHKEIVCVLCLDTKSGVTTTGTAGDLASDLQWGKMLAEQTVFEGTLNSSVFHPREIFRFAIEESANSIVVVHNHPSGDPQPSQEDIRATKQLIEAGNQIGIRVVDHIIIGDGIFVSLKEEGFI